MAAKPLLSAYDKLSEALLGLTLLALDRPRAEHPRLVEQFRKQYPEIVAAAEVVTLRETLDRISNFLGAITPGSTIDQECCLDAISDLLEEKEVAAAWRTRT